MLNLKLIKGGLALLLALGVWGPAVQAAPAPAPVYLPQITNRFVPNYEAPFGITLYNGVDAANGLNVMATTGAHWATAFLDWASIEPNPPVSGQHTYDWSSFDLKVQNARSVGVKLFVLFTGNPAWAATYSGGPVNPANVADLNAFAGAMAARYPEVEYWSFYAEPDNSSLAYAAQGKGYWGNNGAGYADMLAPVATAIHAANPQAKVLIGGIAYNWFTSAGGPFVQSFLGDVLAALNANHGGAANFIDAVAFHYYPTRPNSILATAQEIRTVLSQYGVGSLPLLVPEFGNNSGDNSPGAQASQAAWLARNYVQGLAADLRMLSWYYPVDIATGPTTFDTVGLFVGLNLAQPKQSYFAYKTVVTELYGARYLGPFSSAGAEGYRFQMPGGGLKTAVWATAPGAAADFGMSCLRVVDLLGNLQIVPASAIGLTVGQPVYVSACH